MHVYILYKETCLYSGCPPKYLFTDKELFFFFLAHLAARGISVPQPGIKPGPSAVRAWRLNHWTTREFPGTCFFKSLETRDVVLM